MKKQGKNSKGMGTLKATVTVERVFAYKEDSGWCSFLAEDEDGETRRFVGTLATEPKPGMAYDVTAEEKDTKYGIQYQITDAVQALPGTEAGILEYLAAGNIKGIGEVTARKLVGKFGAETLDVIHNEPERLLEVSGISKKKLEKIIANSEENWALEDIYRATCGVITRLQAKKLHEAYGKDTVKKLREDPYKTLCQLDGIGFLKADKVALGCGIGEFSAMRMENAAMYVLDDVVTSGGDSYVPTGTMEREAVLLLDRMPPFLDKIRGAKKKVLESADSYAADRDLLIHELMLTPEQAAELDAWADKRRMCLPAIADAVIALIGQGEVLYDEAKDRIASKKIYDTEQWIARTVAGMLREGSSGADQEGAEQFIREMEEEGNSYNGDQKAAFLRALANRLSIVTGGPGCGKTTVIALIAGYWSSLGKPVYLMAPTGRAAQRIKESMEEQLPGNGFSISTIHRLLANADEMETLEDYGGDDALVVCDETSMVDIHLAKRFLEMACKFRTVLVGDADQLPPVGAGNFFRDLIASGKVQTTWLTKNYRSTGRIIENSKKIRAGQTDLATGKDFTLTGLDRELIPGRIVQEYMHTLETEKATVRDICVLTLQRKRGAACVDVLNRMLQESCNPKAQDKPEYRMQNYVLRLGDRVIHNKNNYNMERVSQNGERSMGVFNGDLGVIAAFNPEALKAIAEGDSLGEKWLLAVGFDDGSMAPYTETDLLQLELAYAMTVHKAQGSEFPFVIGTYAMDQYTMLGRAITYTSVTRAKKRYCTVCEKKALAMAIRNVGTSRRDTFLQEML
ncbi:MAG: ATP-dependent RecD-like DNA helicase, partial [Ruminococcus flavefaciens]|nr:ATP-dependent RecD-like DNA helicase [Ruminococcus flavefaciens]